MARREGTELLLIRHAEVEERFQRVFGGRIDMGLSPRGSSQAEALAAWLIRKPVAAIYCSPMKRARLTLEPVLRDRTVEPVILDGLREIDFGDWTGLSWQELHDRHQISAFEWLDFIERGAIPQGECAQKFRARIEPCLTGMLERHSGDTVAVVCHGGVIRMLLAILLGLPLPRMRAFDIEYASVTRLRCDARAVEIDLLNFTPWRDGTPT